MFYKYEIHLHTSGCSDCGGSTAKEMVDAAKSAGYSGIVFSNHFYHGNTCIDRALPWKDFVEAYESDYLEAKEYGEKCDIDVLFGIEEAYRQGKEVLIYGISAEILKNTPDFLNMNLYQMAEFTRKNGGLICVAHPFRHRSYIPDPDTVPPYECFDAVEVYNAANSKEDNDAADKYADKFGLLKISGGDTHDTAHFGKAGIAFTERVKDDKTFVELIKNNKHKLIIDGEIL